LPITSELLRVAQRVIWFEEPERALADPVQFLAHVMVFGTVEDLKALQGIVGKDEYREVLEQAPPGIFDARSRAYWNLVCDRRLAPPLPMRMLASDAANAAVNTSRPCSGPCCHVATLNLP
jgi:hypothetical protein